MNETSTLHGVILSNPTLLLNLRTTKADADAPAQSWVQLAVAGSFVSKRYGEFAIAADDLQMMAENFQPDVTPIDYDHLTQDPRSPGDGIAAGWMKRVEVRDDGNTLWGLVEWTPDAEKRIENREYRFISPSFMKDYTTATGEKVGTKLLAAALTNLPFLPEMAAVTLGADAVFGQFALSVRADRTAQTRTVQHLAEHGQRVSFLPDADARRN
jgi:phage I-like protein